MKLSVLIKSLQAVNNRYGELDVEVMTAIDGDVDSFAIDEILVRGVDTDRPYAALLSRNAK